MANNMYCVLGTFVISTVTETVKGWTKCNYYISSSNFYDSTYCDRGCCFSDNWDPCCYYENYGKDSDRDVSVGSIAGIVIGCLLAFSIFIGICICACNAIKYSNQANSGQITRQPQISHISTTNAQTVQRTINNNTGYINESFIIDQSAPPYNDNSNSPPPSYESVINDPKYVGEQKFGSPT